MGVRIGILIRLRSLRILFSAYVLVKFNNPFIGFQICSEENFQLL